MNICKCDSECHKAAGPSYCRFADLTNPFTQVAGRWSIRPHYGPRRGKSRTVWRVIVKTVRDLPPHAYAFTLIRINAASDRRILALAVREARAAAMHFRKTAPRPDWMT